METESEKQLWLLAVNVKVNKIIRESEMTASLALQQKKILKFVKKSITTLRQNLQKKVISANEPDKKMKAELVLKRVLAFEKLILSLTLVLCIPVEFGKEQTAEISETLQQIDELKEVFSDLKLG